MLFGSGEEFENEKVKLIGYFYDFEIISNNMLRKILQRGLSQQKILNISEVEEYWDKFSHDYNTFDHCPLTFYYSLLYMTQIWKARNILEVACGTGKMIPTALNMKQK